MEQAQHTRNLLILEPTLMRPFFGSTNVALFILSKENIDLVRGDPIKLLLWYYTATGLIGRECLAVCTLGLVIVL